MAALRITLLCLCSAVAYGVLHDQVTARVCIEYFTIGHDNVLDTTSPTLLGLYWGVAATWWVGLALGAALAIAARAGAAPVVAARALAKPVTTLAVATACLALLAGVLSYAAASLGWVHLDGDFAGLVPAARQNAFLADEWAHLTSYGFAAAGGILVCVWTWRVQRRRASNHSVA